MNDKELDALLQKAVGQPVQPPDYVNTRLRGELALARRAGRSLSLWWLPLALAVAVSLPLFLLGVLAPWPARVLLKICAVLPAGATALLTVAGLLCFDLKERGKILLSPHSPKTEG